MEKVVKTAIAIPQVEYKQIEILRVQMGKTRSQLLMEAFRAWLLQREEAEMEAKYRAGYLKHPEKPQEIKPLTRAGLAAWEKESWT
ncbi:MAG: hypothetical protein WC859_06480 [Elusimicrobiota bacterium]|jgi:metal-responsive CopG/Arc/MetJ family transcriptional regulator